MYYYYFFFVFCPIKLSQPTSSTFFSSPLFPPLHPTGEDREKQMLVLCLASYWNKLHQDTNIPFYEPLPKCTKEPTIT